MIKKILIENWRCHSKSVFSFDRGTNGLIGLMGAGKTSVLDAVCFSFFGTFPTLQARKLNLDDIIMVRPVKKDQARTMLDFELDGKNYQVERVIKHGKGTIFAELRCDGDVVETGTTRVTKKIEEILKMNYDLFSRAVYAEQNALDYFLTIPRGQRMRKLDELLRIDRFEKAKSSTTTIINRLRELAKTKQRLIEESGAREEIKKIPAIEEKIRKKEKEQDEIVKKLNEINKKADSLREAVQKHEAGKEELERLRRERASLEATISNFRQDIERMQKELGKRKAMDPESIESELKKEKTMLEKMIRKREEIEGRLRKTLEAKQEILVQIRNLNEKIEKIRGISGRCPVCDRRLTEEHRKKLVQERKERIKGLQPQLEKKEKEIAKFDAWLLKDKEEQRRREEFIRNLQEILRKRMELDEKVKLEAEKELKLKKIIANVRKLEKRFAAEIIKSMHHKLQKLVAEKSAMQEKANACKELVLDLRERLKSLQEKKNMLIKQEQEIKRAELVCKEMQKFHNALTETQLSLRQQFITSVNATMADVWAELYPYGDYSSVRLGVEAGDYTLQLLGGGGWVSVERVASGGERTVACLALRIAFSLALAQNLRWLVLDEPTHNLDERAVKDLANVLRSKITEFVDQVFLITHDPRLEDGVTGYLYRLERAKEKSEPTQVRCVTSPSD